MVVRSTGWRTGSAAAGLLAVMSVLIGPRPCEAQTIIGVRESDRLAVMSKGLRRLGVEVRDYEDGVDITGTAALKTGILDSAGDHRCAMSFAVLAQRAPGGARIRNADYIATSYPGFVDDINSLGADLSMVDTS